MARFRLTPDAEQDLQEIKDFIARDDRHAARIVIRRLRKAMEGLAEMSGKGHRRPDLTEADLRFWPVHDFLIVYRPAARPLEIIAVVSGWRDLGALLERRPLGDIDG